MQLALHHPVRLAVQTSVLDNLRKGRLLVGTGRGSLYSHYEYMGFGVTLEHGREMMDEAEELLVKAWSGGPVDHEGKFWQVSLSIASASTISKTPSYPDAGLCDG